MFFVAIRKPQNPGVAVAEWLGLSLGQINTSIIDKTIIARYPPAVIRYYISHLERSDAAAWDFDHFVSKMKNDPVRFVTRYPNMVWAFAIAHIKPNDRTMYDGGIRYQSDVRRMIGNTLGSEAMVAHVIEELGDLDQSAAPEDEAQDRLDWFIVSIRPACNEQDVKRFKAAYACVPLHLLGTQVLVFLSWVIGKICPEAFSELLSATPIDFDFFMKYPNLALLVKVFNHGKFDRVLVRVARDTLIGGPRFPTGPLPVLSGPYDTVCIIGRS